MATGNVCGLCSCGHFVGDPCLSGCSSTTCPNARRTRSEGAEPEAEDFGPICEHCDEIVEDCSCERLLDAISYVAENIDTLRSRLRSAAGPSNPTEGGDPHTESHEEPGDRPGDMNEGESGENLAARREDGRGDSPEGGTAPEKARPSGSPDATEVIGFAPDEVPYDLGGKDLEVLGSEATPAEREIGTEGKGRAIRAMHDWAAAESAWKSDPDMERAAHGLFDAGGALADALRRLTGDGSE